MARNPYAPPQATVGETAGTVPFSVPVQLLRVLAMMGNGLFALLPVFYLFSGYRPDIGIVAMSAYCLILAACSTFALFSRTWRPIYLMSAIVLNSIAVLLFIYLLVETNVTGVRDITARVLLVAPALLNLAAVALVRKGRARLVNELAA